MFCPLRPTVHVPPVPRLMPRTVIRLIVSGALFAWALVGAVGCGSVTPAVMAVVECEFADPSSMMELPQSYYTAYFQPGTGGIYDYFKQVSYNKKALSASIFGPYTIPGTYTSQFYGSAFATPMTLNQYMGLMRINQIKSCLGAAADAGANLTPYKEIIALQVTHDRLAAYGNPVTAVPNTTTLTAAVGSTDTTLQVQSSAGFPTPPFPAFIQDAAGPIEDAAVTAESGPGNTTWTVTRGFQPQFPAVPHAVGAQVWTAFTSDIGALGGAQTITVGTGSYQVKLTGVGLMTMDPLGSPTIVAQEIGHGLFNLNHSRDFINQTADYQDAWDVMSGVVTPFYYESQQPAFASQAGYTTTPEHYVWGGGPGFDAVYLDYLGWLSASDEDTGLVPPPSSCTSHGITLDALSQKASHKLEARLPYTSQPGFPANGQYYTVEFRNPTKNGTNTLWDSAIPEPTVLVHLAVAAPSNAIDPYISYLVDSTINGALDITGAHPGGHGGTPQFVAGSTFVDPTSHAYLAVNQIDGSTSIAHVTIGNCSLPTKVTYVGATSAASGSTVTLAANLATNPSVGMAWPVYNQLVTFFIGNPQSTLSCTATTDSLGHAACMVTVQRMKGSTKVTASFAGTTAYQAASTTVMFQVT